MSELPDTFPNSRHFAVRYIRQNITKIPTSTSPYRPFDNTAPSTRDRRNEVNPAASWYLTNENTEPVIPKAGNQGTTNVESPSRVDGDVKNLTEVPSSRENRDDLRRTVGFHSSFCCQILGILGITLLTAAVITASVLVPLKIISNNQSVALNSSTETSLPATTTTTTTGSNTSTNSTSSISSASPTSTSTTISTTTATTLTTTTATTAPTCTVTGRGNLFHDQHVISSWTKVTRNYTATATTPLLVFAADGGGHDFYLLDTTSVVDVTLPLVQLLDNPGFDNSTGGFSGWNQWCAGGCTGGTQNPPADDITSGCQSGSCISINCGTGRSTPLLLGQSFSATIGHVYTISFWLQYSGGGGADMYVDVF